MKTYLPLMIFLPLEMVAPAQVAALGFTHDFRRSTLKAFGGGDEIGWITERRVGGGLAEVSIGRCDSAEDLIVSIPDSSDDAAALSSSLWPSALAGSVLLRSPELRSALSGKDVLELGSGLGLAGIVAANAPAKRCVLTDKDEDAVAALSDTISRNKIKNCDLLARRLDWRENHDVNAPADVIVGTDLAYYFFLLRPLMDAARIHLSQDDGLLYIVGQANRESQWDLFRNMINGCYNQLTDQHELPWPGVTKMLLYDLSIGPWQDTSGDDGDTSPNDEVPIAVLLHSTNPDKLPPLLKATDHVATKTDEEKQMFSF